MRTTFATLTVTLISLISAFAGEPTAETFAILKESVHPANSAYRVYVEKYHRKEPPTEEAELADRKHLIEVFRREAKALWDAYDSISVGDSIFKYPGLLGHGAIRWDNEKQCYCFRFGFGPFSYGDALGEGDISFDLTGKVIEKSKVKYPW